MAWVEEACGFFAKEQAGTLKQTDVYLFRVAQMLGEYEAHGAVLRRYSRTVSKVTGDGAAVVARFEAWLRAAERSTSTVRSYGTLAGEFAAFCGTRGGLARCDAGTIGAFTATMAGYQAKTVEQKLCAPRSFLRFASQEGLAAPALAEAVPAVPSRKQARVPSVWDPGDVARILEAVDRGSPCGKRDYAIILLVTRLGLRSIDVKRLEFADFDWPANRLSVAQAKTGRRVQLPLLKDVGWAVIDYVRTARPASDCPQVFLRHAAPVGPFSDQDHLHQILVKHARDGQPDLCGRCYQGPERECSRCGRMRPCVRAPAECARCRQSRPLIGRDMDGAGLCGTCAGTGADFACRRCGRSGYPYGHGGCAYCVLADEVAGLLAGPDGIVAPELKPLTEAFTRVHRPFNAISWVRHSPAAGLLRHLAGQQRPVTHDLLDELPPGHSLHYLRQVLVQTGILPERDEDLERVPAWLEHHLDGQPPEHALLVRPFLHWSLLRRARSRAARRPFPASIGRQLRLLVMIALELLAWTDQQGTTLAGLRQDDVDRWLAEEQTSGATASGTS